MARNTGIPTRSLYGCWTCRVRRKKCDEIRPSCTTCSSLDLECHGYGPKPEWMDNGILQREKTIEFKNIVGQNKWKRGKQDARAIPSTQGHNKEFGQFALTPNGPNISSTSPYSVQQNPFMREANFGDSSQFGTLPSNEQLFQAPFYSGIGTSQPAFLEIQDDYPPRIQFTKTMDLRQNMTAPTPASTMLFASDLPTVHSHEYWDIGSPNIIEAAPNRIHDSLFVETMLTAPETGSLPFHEATTIYNCANLANATNSNGVQTETELPSTSVTLLTDKLQDSQREDGLFMHYLDEVFYSQNSFYNRADKLGRAWLFSIIKQIKPAYHATLALSELDLLLSTPSQNHDTLTSLEHLRAKNSYYDLAHMGLRSLIDETRTVIRTTPLIDSLNILTTILQLLSWELFAGGLRNWQELLGLAAPLIAPLIQARMPPGIPDLTYPSPTNQTHSNYLSPEQNGATCVLLGSYISLDIISSASTRSAPFLDIDHVQALNNLGITLERLMGCRNSVMALIFEISALDQWKKASQIARKLSIVDLAKRSAQIESRLRQELANQGSMSSSAMSLPLSSSSGASSLSGNYSSMYWPPPHPEVSKAYALAAIIYLHVVISGPLPELSEIAGPVAEAIDLFHSMKDNPKLLRNMVWPLCVCGCLALGDEQQSFFSNLLASTSNLAGEFHFPVGTCFEAFKIMKQCWETRNTCPFDCDWASIMESNGCSVLLR